MTNIKTMMEEMAQEELERDGAACREVMQSRKSAGAERHGKMRLIDADALTDGEFPEAENEYQKGWNDGLRGAMIAAPTVDAVPVVHGRWIKKRETIHWVYQDTAECSACGEEFVLDEYDMEDIKMLFHYCPNCGARMDGDEDG